MNSVTKPDNQQKLNFLEFLLTFAPNFCSTGRVKKGWNIEHTQNVPVSDNEVLAEKLLLKK